MEPWTNLTARVRELDALSGANAVLDWDQQTQMPEKAAENRGEQSALLQRLYHERFTAPEVGDWLAALRGSALDETQAASVRLLSRRYSRSVGLPTRLVEDLARARNDGFTAWVKAKAADDFSMFADPLQRLIDLTREQAERLATPDCAHPYDALLEDYDPGSTVALLQPMFDRLAGEIGTFLQAIDGLPQPASFADRLDVDGQKRLSQRVIRDLGFDTAGGRIDLAAHPFSTNLGIGDVRLTTRYDECDLLSGLGSTIHECGHGMYEQGLPNELHGTGLNAAASYGLHESQSRFWENFIGRSLPFFRYLVPRMQAIWPSLEVSPERLYAAANRVERSLIRVEADEATYNLHIIVRFGLELDILAGNLQARDLPEAWVERYRSIVGVVPGSAKTGVLQDVHWSSALFGYFPSYTLGNLYAASLSARMLEDIPAFWTHVERGEFSPILAWLRAQVHTKGHRKDGHPTFLDAAGGRDPVADLVAHLWSRHGSLYGVVRA